MSSERMAAVAAVPRPGVGGMELPVLIHRRFSAFGAAEVPVEDPFGFERAARERGEPLSAVRKAGTDVLVVGTVCPPGAPVRSGRLQVLIDRREVFRALVVGDRRATRCAGGWEFSEPEAFHQMPLSVTRCYGGTDELYDPPEVVGEEALLELLTKVLIGIHPGAYRRNPVGVGYLAADRPVGSIVALPNFELEDEPLTTSRVVVTPADAWRAPRPAHLGCHPPSFFPRCAYAGGLDGWPNDELLPEVRAGVEPRGFGEGVVPSARLANMANPALSAGFLGGGEVISLRGFTASPVEIVVPGQCPRVEVRTARMAAGALAQLFTVRIDLDSGTLDCVWVARVVDSDPEWDVEILTGRANELEVRIDGALAPAHVEPVPRLRLGWPTDSGTIDLLEGSA